MKNHNKIKYLYKVSYEYTEVTPNENSYYVKKYHKNMVDYLVSKKLLLAEQIIDETAYWDERYKNMKCFRKKSGYRQSLQSNAVCKEFNINGISTKKIMARDPYMDDQMQAWDERKSWKRNSKRKHQWKIKEN